MSHLNQDTQPLSGSILAGGLGWARRWQPWWRVPSTPAIVKARARLGAEPLARLFVEEAYQAAQTAAAA
jgi:hypothetical protein